MYLNDRSLGELTVRLGVRILLEPENAIRDGQRLFCRPRYAISSMPTGCGVQPRPPSTSKI